MHDCRQDRSSDLRGSGDEFRQRVESFADPRVGTWTAEFIGILDYPCCGKNMHPSEHLQWCPLPCRERVDERITVHCRGHTQRTGQDRIVDVAIGRQGQRRAIERRRTSGRAQRGLCCGRRPSSAVGLVAMRFFDGTASTFGRIGDARKCSDRSEGVRRVLSTACHTSSRYPPVGPALPPSGASVPSLSANSETASSTSECRRRTSAAPTTWPVADAAEHLL